MKISGVIFALLTTKRVKVTLGNDVAWGLASPQGLSERASQLQLLQGDCVMRKSALLTFLAGAVALASMACVASPPPDETTPVEEPAPNNGLVEVRVDTVDMKDARHWFKVNVVTLDQYAEYGGVENNSEYEDDSVAIGLFKSLTLDLQGNSYGFTLVYTDLGSPSAARQDCDNDPYRCTFGEIWLVGLAVADRDSKVSLKVAGVGNPMEVELQ